MTWNGLITLAATGATAVLAYLFQVLMARWLTTQEYGELSAIVATLTVLTVPVVGMGMAVTRAVAAAAARASGSNQLAVVRPYVLRVIGMTAAMTLALALSGTWLVGFLQLSSPTPLVYLALLVALTNAVGTGRAVLLGLHQFALVAINQIAEALVRLAAAGAMALYGLTAVAGLSGYAAGLVLALVLTIERTRKQLAPDLCATAAGFGQTRPTRVEPLTERDIGWAAVIVTGTFIVLLNMDLIVVKHFLPPDTAGQYSAISTLAKALFVITNAFDVVLFPLATSARATGASDTAHLRRALLNIGVLVLPLLTAYGLFSQPLTGLLFGARYADVARVLLPYASAVTLLGLATLTARYRLAVGHGVPSPVLLVLVGAAALGFLRFHDTVDQVVGVLMAVAIASLIATLPTHPVQAVISSVRGVRGMHAESQPRTRPPRARG